MTKATQQSQIKKSSKTCALCGKGSQMQVTYKKLRGHYNPTGKKRKYPNLQWVRIPIGIKKKAYKDFAGKRILACTKCIKAIGKTR